MGILAFDKSHTAALLEVFAAWTFSARLLKYPDSEPSESTADRASWMMTLGLVGAAEAATAKIDSNIVDNCMLASELERIGVCKSVEVRSIRCEFS